MNAKIIGGCLLAILFAMGAWLFSSQMIDTAPAHVEETDSSSAMRVEENMVVVSEQRPGYTVIGTVHLAAEGYFVIHADTNGESGVILGASTLLTAGKNTNVKVKLSRASRDGETLHAMLYFEKDGNTAFSAADTPVPSSLGGPIEGLFQISKDAPSETPVSI